MNCSASVLLACLPNNAKLSLCCKSDPAGDCPLRVQHFIVKQKLLWDESERLWGHSHSGVELRSAITKPTRSARQCQKKMINYKAVERKSMCWRVQMGRWQRAAQ